MKNIISPFLILFILCNYSCSAQIHEELKGIWLPEKYVLDMIKKDTNNADKYRFPVEGFEISKEKTLQFYNLYSDEYETFDTNRIILILTYKSELNTILTDEVINEGKGKYRLPYFYGGLNMKYISRETVDWYKKAEVYISKSGDKLLFEAIGSGKHEKIYFVNGFNGYKFKDIENANEYLKNIGSLTPNKAGKTEYSGTGSTAKELSLTGKETSLKLSYEFYTEPDQLIVEDQSGKQLYKTKKKTTASMQMATVPLKEATKLIFRIKSDQPNSKWKFSVEVK